MGIVPRQQADMGEGGEIGALISVQASEGGTIVLPEGASGQSILRAIDIADARGDWRQVARLEEMFRAWSQLMRDGDIPGDSTLGLSVVANSHKISPPPTGRLGTATEDRAPRGSQGITIYGRRMLKSGAALLQAEYPGSSELAFCTLTLPKISDEQCRAICSQWPEIFRKFFQDIKRLYARSGHVAHWAACTEIQPQRLIDYGQLPLHVHFVINSKNPDTGEYFISKEWLQKKWEIRLSSAAGEPISCLYATQIQAVRKNLGRELGAYIGKGKAILSHLENTEWQQYIPSSWWGMSTVLNKSVKAAIYKGGNQQSSDIWSICERISADDIIKFRKIFIHQWVEKTQSFAETCVGFSVFFPDDEAMHAIARACDIELPKLELLKSV